MASNRSAKQTQPIAAVYPGCGTPSAFCGGFAENSNVHRTDAVSVHGMSARAVLWQSQSFGARKHPRRIPSLHKPVTTANRRGRWTVLICSNGVSFLLCHTEVLSSNAQRTWPERKRTAASAGVIARITAVCKAKGSSLDRNCCRNV